jgi:hypothetical protein
MRRERNFQMVAARRALRVGERFARFRSIFQFADLENLAAVEALDVLGFVIFGDDLGPSVLAGGLKVCVWHSGSEEQSAS